MPKSVKRSILLFIISLAWFSCDEDVLITFKEQNISKTANAVIDVNYPKVIGNTTTATRINNTLESFIITQITGVDSTQIQLPDINRTIEEFDTEFIAFRNKFADSAQKWEVLIDSEVVYESPEIISIAVNSYINTGGAHGNSQIEFLNFNPINGAILNLNDLIINLEGFTRLVEDSFKLEIKASEDSSHMEDFFFGKEFQLPESFGFSDEGLIILYNPYEIASYSQGITEFSIPFEKLSNFLKVH